MAEKSASAALQILQVQEPVPARDDQVNRYVEATDAAQLAGQPAEVKYDPWTKSMFRLYGCLLVAYFCACLSGYDGSLMGGLNAMKSYQDYFHT